MIRITAAASATIIDAANHYAMCIGMSQAEADTYHGLNWQDAQGNLYAATSFTVRHEWLGAAQSPLVRPDWDTTGIVDMALAEQGQAALRFWSPDMALAEQGQAAQHFWSPDMAAPGPLATPATLTAYANSGIQEALLAMGLVPVTDEAMS